MVHKNLLHKLIQFKQSKSKEKKRKKVIYIFDIDEFSSFILFLELYINNKN